MTQPSNNARREIDQLERIAADAQRQPVERATALLTAHQRMDVGSCLCGWAKLGRSHPAHQVAVLDSAGLLAALTPEAGAGRRDQTGRAHPTCIETTGHAELNRGERSYVCGPDCPPVPEIHTETGPASTQAAETGTAKGTGRVEPPTRLSGPLHRTKLGDLIIEHGPFTPGEWISDNIADVLTTAAAVNELREELIAARKANGEQERFSVEAVGTVDDGDEVWLCCDRCGTWQAELGATLGLGELNRRAGEHAEVCR